MTILFCQHEFFDMVAKLLRGAVSLEELSEVEIFGVIKTGF
jgi:hypothetical protein